MVSYCYPSTLPTSTSDVDLLVIQQAEYLKDMQTNVVAQVDIPFAPHLKMCWPWLDDGGHTEKMSIHMLCLPLSLT